MSGEGAEREGDTESEVGSRLWAVSAQPWDHDLSQSQMLNWPSHLDALIYFPFLKKTVTQELGSLPFGLKFLYWLYGDSKMMVILKG